MNNRLPNYDYQYKLDLYGNFNNQLMSGINQGLSLYSPQYDTQLYKQIDYDPISTRNINFDQINKELDGKDNFYDKGKNLVQGFVDQVNKATDQTEKNIKDTYNNVINNLKNLFTIPSEYKFLAVAILFFWILNKK